MSDMTDGYVYFYIHGDDLDPDMCTARIEISPTRTTRKGDFEGEKRPLARTGRWELKLYNNEMREINADTETLLDMLLPSKKAIRSILEDRRFIAGIYCVVYVVDERPCLKLSAECLRKLSELGVDYEIDYYDYTKCDEQEDETSDKK